MVDDFGRGAGSTGAVDEVLDAAALLQCTPSEASDPGSRQVNWLTNHREESDRNIIFR